MHVTLTLNDNLLQQARSVSGLDSDKELLEQGLLALIKQTEIQQRGIGKVSKRLTPAKFESPEQKTAYQGPPLSIDEMNAAVLAEAEQRK